MATAESRIVATVTQPSGRPRSIGADYNVTRVGAHERTRSPARSSNVDVNVGKRLDGRMETLEAVRCYVCGKQNSEVWARENGHVAVRCGDCGLVYVDPRPRLENISAGARTGLHEGAGELNVIGSYGGEPRVRRYKDILRDLYGDGYFYKSGESWLDYGCGYGEFLEALRQESGGALKLTGLEPNEVKAASARQRGLDVSFDSSMLKRRFHYISLLNVYSHLPNPPETLAELAEGLEPGGEVLIETGNFAELEREQIPTSLDLPDHLSFAGERLLRRVLEKTGFRVQKVVRYPMFARPRGLRARLSAPKPARGCSDMWIRASRS
jgi:2-polyprenyl-3-methyl-5-hydroxy-6-metoxy-1,4-benzoquinol methylase